MSTTAATPTPPAPGLVQKTVNGVVYWQDPETKKLHSPVKFTKAPVAAKQAAVPAVEVPATPAPVPSAIEAAVDVAVENLVHAITAEVEHAQPPAPGAAS